MRGLIAVLFIVAGAFAIAEPMVAGLAVAVLVGWALLLGAAAHLVAAFTAGGIGKGAWQILIAVGYGIGAAYFLTHPLLGLGTLTLLLAAVLLVETVVELMLWAVARGLPGSGWRLANAVATALLAGLIAVHWPSTSTWAIGTLVGVNLMFTGVTRLMLAAALRGFTRA